jgi:hypothetical protein
MTRLQNSVDRSAEREVRGGHGFDGARLAKIGAETAAKLATQIAERVFHENTPVTTRPAIDRRSASAPRFDAICVAD